MCIRDSSLSNPSLSQVVEKIKIDDCVKISPCFWTCGDSVLGTPHRLFYVPSAAFRPHPWHGLRTENLHGAKETPTAKKGREKPVRGGKGGQGRKRRSGEEAAVRGGIKPGRKQRQRSCPLMQQTPALHCGRCPCLWNDEHVLVMPAVV